MHRFIRIPSWLLAALTIVSAFVGCAPASESPSDSSGSRLTESIAETDVETVDPIEEALAVIRETVDFGGEDFGIMYVNDVNGYYEEVEAVEKVDSSSSSAVINDAVFSRNTLFEEYGNLEFVLIPISVHSVGSKMLAEVSAGANDFFLNISTAYQAAYLATKGQLYNYFDLDIDYKQSWWDQGPQDFAIKGKVFFMNGSFDIIDDDMTFVMMFNKKMQKDYHVDNLYQVVKDQAWTLNYFNSVVSTISAETSGDGKWNEEDTYGFATPSSVGTSFFYGAGLRYIRFDASMDKPELVLTGALMEKALDVLAISREIVHENHSTYVAPLGESEKALNNFKEGRSLFYCEIARVLRTLNAQMNAEYGILPQPKYDEQQEHYYTWVANNSSALAMPSTVGATDTESLARVLELYAILSQKFVRPAYYEHLLTTRNVRDAESSEMLDMIYPYRTYDMSNYFEDLKVSGPFGKSVYQDDTFISSYTAVTKNFDRICERLFANIKD